MKTYVLYGVADRDKTELVCMFFDRKKDVKRFREALPGNYARITLKNVDYKTLKIGKIK